MVYSTMITSMAKITPASGVLNDAAIAAAAPQATRIRILLFGQLQARAQQRGDRRIQVYARCLAANRLTAGECDRAAEKLHHKIAPRHVALVIVQSFEDMHDTNRARRGGYKPVAHTE